MALTEMNGVLMHLLWEDTERKKGKERSHPKLSKTARLVWVILAQHKNHQNGLCCPSYERIMLMAGISNRNTLSDALKELEACGVKVEHSGRSNRYTWALPDRMKEIREEVSKEEANATAGKIDEEDEF